MPRINSPKQPDLDENHDKMINYIIYCITSERAGISYIGSTTCTLAKRTSEHKHDAAHKDARGEKASALVLREPDNKVFVLESGTCTRFETDYVLLRELYHIHNYRGNICNYRNSIDLKNVIRESRAITHNMPDIERLFRES